MPSYQEVREHLKTGDIVLFSGKGAISNVIKLFSGGKWSHVGMVVRIPAFEDITLLWESTSLSDVPDIESAAPIKGVQLVPLSQRLASYRGEALVRHLNKRVSDEMTTRLALKRKQLSRRPYETSEMELLRAAWDGLGGVSRAEDLSSVFCSELVAEAYQAMGLLPEYPEGLPSNEYTPMDFSEAGKQRFELKNGYELGEEHPIGY